MSLDVGDLVFKAFQGAAKGGAARHSLAAMVAALVRSAAPCGMQLGEDELSVGPEVVARLAAIQPVLAAKVQAGAEGQKAQLTGQQRASRNVAEHCLLGEGAEVLGVALKSPQAAQRAGHGKRLQEDLRRIAVERDHLSTALQEEQGKRKELEQKMRAVEDLLLEKEDVWVGERITLRAQFGTIKEQMAETSEKLKDATAGIAWARRFHDLACPRICKSGGGDIWASAVAHAGKRPRWLDD